MPIDEMEDGIGTEPHLCAMVHVFESATDEQGRIDLSKAMLPPPWYHLAEAPPCNERLDIPAERTNDGRARTFHCDRMRGHPERGDFDDDDRHRQVMDNDAGRTFTWPV